MDNSEHELHYFDYVKLAKKAYRELTARYPELAGLSARELEIFEQLLTNKTQAMIAEELFISHSAVHFHCKNIYKKLNISSRRQLLITYAELCRLENNNAPLDK
ncbi:MAG: helix-turn-helix transcriptional regulator [Peptococcaceae bacterium]|nr:helix-turn-helix transcriptional regulator [Peptococcaceae bacterium]MBQ6853276.1 helix-turn-helix transcriptional regulator [Peptococcaceae bacterium]